MTNKTRRILCVALILLLVVCSVLLLCQAEHHCTGEGCTTCALLHHTLSRFALLLCALMLCGCLTALAAGLFRALRFCVRNTLPVAQGVRLNR